MIREMNINEFDMIFSIMEKSFPIDEYRPFNQQKILLDNPKYKIYVLPDNEDDKVKAFISIWRLGEFAFIEHFAVNPIYRNQGLGSLILTEIKGMFDCKMCLEVEPPETEFAKRRIEFYRRNGFYLNEYPYMQPSIAKGRKPIPLLIMTTDGPVSKERFEEISETIHKDVYLKMGSISVV